MSNLIQDKSIFTDNGNNGGGGTGTVTSVVAGTNISVDNTDPANPIVSSTVKVPIEVVNYSALPAAGSAAGQMYIVLASQGTKWLPGSLGGTYYPKGYYYDNGSTYTFSEVPYNASQATVDAGTNEDEFVTPKTLENFTRLKNTSGTNTGDETTTTIGALINSAITAVSLQLTDKLAFRASSDGLLSAITFSDFRDQLKTYFDGLYTSALLAVNNTSWKVITGNTIQTAFNDVDEELLESRNTGLIYGGACTITGATSVSIAAGKGEILDSLNPATLDYQSVTWSTTSLTGLPSGLSYIYVNSLGVVTSTTTAPSHNDYRTKIWLHRVSVTGGTITAVNSIVMPLLQYPSGLWDIWRAYGLVKRDLIVSANGVNLKINIGAGEIYQPGINFYVDPNNPHEASFTATSPQTFRMATSTGTITADVTDLPVANYDVGGVVTAIPGAAGRASIFTIYKFPQGNVRILYGNAWYTSITTAFTALSTYVPTPPTGYDQAIILGYIIATKSATDLTNATQATFVLTNRFGGMGGALSANFSSFLQIANDLSDLASAKTARVNLGLDKQTNGGDTNYNILATDKTVVTGTTFTGAHTWTLPDASTVNAGYEIIVTDELQTVTSTNTLTIAVQTGQKLNGTTNGTEVMQASGTWRRLVSDGVSNWTFDNGIVRTTKTQTLTNKTIDAPIITGLSKESKGADIASASTVDLSAATGNYVKVTGTTTITSFGTVQAGTEVTVEFTGALTITHNATSLILPDAVDFKTTAGDVCKFVSLGSGNWKCIYAPVQYDSWFFGPASSASPADSTTAYTGVNQVTMNTTSDNKSFITARAGTIVRIDATAFIATILGSSENVTVALRNHTTTTDITVSSTFQMTAVSNYASYTTPTTFSAGDRFEEKWAYPAFATNPTGVFPSLRVKVRYN